MTVRQDDSIEDFINVDSFRDRAAVRRMLLTKFIDENCKTKRRYYVETIDTTSIYIERPGQLNKGCDFVIYVENLIQWKNGNDKPPAHDDLLADLREKKANLNANEFNRLLAAIRDIYELKPFHVAIAHTVNLPSIGWDYELILKLTRWFFIEQDITYWAKSGRDMLFETIQNL